MNLEEFEQKMTRTFYLAYCKDCWPNSFTPMPFDVEDERDKWAEVHTAFNEHEIEYSVEVRV